jgi:hypothetical protein
MESHGFIKSPFGHAEPSIETTSCHVLMSPGMDELKPEESSIFPAKLNEMVLL